MTRSGRYAEREAGQHAGRRPRPAASSRIEQVHPADGEHGAPQGQRQAAVPGHRRQGDRRHDVEHREGGDGRRGGPSPGPGQREQPEDDGHVLQQPERALGRQRVPEDVVPGGQDLQRARAVEVQEVLVRHVAAGQALREVEHEALLHRPAREAVQPAQRDGHEHADDGDAQPRAEGAPLATAQPTGAAEHEGRRVVAHRTVVRLVVPGALRGVGVVGHAGNGCLVHDPVQPSSPPARAPAGGMRAGRGVGRDGDARRVPVPQRTPRVRSRLRDRDPRGAADQRRRAGRRAGVVGAMGRAPPVVDDRAGDAGRRPPAARGRRRAARRTVVPGARPGDDRVPRPRRLHRRHAPDRVARPHRDVPGGGQPPGPAELLPAGPDLSPAGVLVLGARGRHRRHPPRGDRHGAVDRAAPARVEGRSRRRRAHGARGPRLRPGAADPAVEPVPPTPGVDRRPAGGVGGAVRRPPDARPARRRRHVLRPDPRPVPRRSVSGWSCSASARRPLQIWRAPDVERGRRLAQRVVERRHRRRAVAPAGGRPADEPAGQHPPARRPLRLAARSGDRRRRRRPHRAAPPRRLVRARWPTRRDRPLRRHRLRHAWRHHARSCGSSPSSWRGASAAGRCARCTSSSASRWRSARSR